jgi:serine/threonine protein kinase
VNPSTPLAAAASGASSQTQEEEIKNKHRDIWAFGCVLYELATHRRPWYHKMESSSSCIDSQLSDSKLPQTLPDQRLFFLRTWWKHLGTFHGGAVIVFHDASVLFCIICHSGVEEGDDAEELKFAKDQRVPPCLLEAIRLCTQKDPELRPHDIQVIIEVLEQFSSVGSKRVRSQQ